MTDRQRIQQAKRWVVKIGSALLTADGQGLDSEAISAWTEQMAKLRQQGIELVLVSSGAVAEGMTRLGWKERPHSIHHLQAAAAVGQMGLVQAYESRFQRFGLHTAQVLLGHDDISARDRYLNARSTLTTLLELGVIPVVNENDTVVTDEIRFGDNDTLAALVANFVDADALIILTDQQGLYEHDPRSDPSAALVSAAKVGDPVVERMAGGSAGALGRGGMITKVRAAKLAERSGTNTVIAGGSIPDVLLKIAAGEEIGTLLYTERRPLTARKQWLAGMMQTAGKLVLDAGAARVVREQGKSLLPVGVQAVAGSFKRGDYVSCIDQDGHEVARGLVNYDSDEVEKILGCSTHALEERLGYPGDEELIHRDNLVVV
jgi:glutamate 5-kinase